MALVFADADAIDQFANNASQLIEAGFAVIECLAVSGNHGTRQGLAIDAAIAQFHAVLGPEITRALVEVVEHARATSAIAGVVRSAESEMTASIAAYATKAESELTLSGSKVL